jgi:hypothetical protein
MQRVIGACLLLLGLTLSVSSQTINVGNRFAGITNPPALIAITGAATTQLIAAPVSPLAIYVTHWDAQVSALAGTFQLVYGAGTNCGTGQGNLTGVYSWTQQSGVQVGNGGGVIYSVPAGNAICATTTGSTASFNGAMGYLVQ